MTLHSSPRRSVSEIAAGGAAWVTESELARLCDAIEAIVNMPVDEGQSAGWHFAEVRRIAREAA